MTHARQFLLPGIEADPVLKMLDTGLELPLVEVEPGKFAVDIPRGAVPKFGVVTLNRLENGDLRPVIRSWGQEVRLTDDLPAKLGLDLTRSTLIRLIHNGHIKGRKPAPGCIIIDLKSLFEHLDRCRFDHPDGTYWTKQRVEDYDPNVY